MSDYEARKQARAERFTSRGTRAMPANYSHVGRRAWTGSYAIGADAYRKPGKVHALNPAADGSQEFVSLCGVRVAMWSDDHFLQDEPQVVPVTPGHRITCRRCLKALH